jgi:hypothetical protein
MVVKVLSRVGQALSHSLGGFSLAPDSMLLRLRRASLALLGLVGAVGLGLVVFISQLGWPGALTSPLPSPPAKIGTIHDGVALTQPGPRGRAVAGRQSGVAAAGLAPGAARRIPRGSGESGLGNSRKLAVAPAASPAPGSQPPSPSPPTPAPEPAPVVSTPAPSSPTTAGVEKAPTTTGASKASNDSARAAGLAPAKSQGQPSTAGKDSSSSSKATEPASGKARRDESAATPAAPASAAPASSSPAAAKEAADAANASQGRH